MPAKVVDASAIAALLFGEPEAETVAVRIDGSQLMAPALFGFELANVCVIKGRRHPEQREALATAFRLRERLSIDVVGIDHDEVIDLAETSNLTAYDASYLWLARRLGAELVTLDRKLASAAAGL